jgi:NTP pyrophosphatase (non-canonical NTP hydrolase)
MTDHQPNLSALRLASLSLWIDTANSAKDPEAQLWGRVAKVAEEVGEVGEAWIDALAISSGKLIAAMIGATGQNPRKGQTHTMDDVTKELLDVALTALCAVEHLHGNRAESFARLHGHVEFVYQRAGLLDA